MKFISTKNQTFMDQISMTRYHIDAIKDGGMQ